VHHVYVADTGNGRIVKLDKEGNFVRQYRPPEGAQFNELHTLYVDELRGRLVLLAGGSLYLADIPQSE
jgi:DNA-binding beta-propeller fold protein YncE